MNNLLAPGSLLGQVRPANTTAATAFTATLNTALTSVVICNTSGAACTARLFHDDTGGATYDQTTALLYDIALAADETVIFESGLKEDGLTVKPGGVIGVRTSVNSAITFSLYGVTQQAR